MTAEKTVNTGNQVTAVYPTVGEQVPAQEVVPLDAGWLVQRTNDLLAMDHGDVYPSFGGNVGLYTRDLEGVPFVFTSDAVLRTQPAKQLDDGRKIPEQEVIQVWVRVLNAELVAGPSELATLSGRYLVNQLRASTRDDLVGAGIFMVARNPRFVAVNGAHPYMIKRYEHGVDSIRTNDVTTWEELDRFTSVKPITAVANRVAEIAAAGGPLPPDVWDDGNEPAPPTTEPETMTRAEFLAQASFLGYNSRAAMQALGVRSLDGINYTHALKTLVFKSGALKP